MTVSIRRMSLGAGFEYLMGSVARGDGATPYASPLTAYYAESGTPPGWYLGAGLALLDDGRGVEAGSQVSEDALWRLLGMLADPVTGEPLGARPRKWPTPIKQRVAARVAELPADLPSADRAEATTLIEAEETDRERRVARPVAGFDLTFSVPKSVSTVWALADPATQQAIHTAHRDAITLAIAWAEENIIFSRTGHNGVVQERVRGVVGTAFDHWDSRAGDPHLHTHVVVANRVQTSDGKWRTIDSKTLHRYVVALSELHEGVVQDLLTARLGYGWTEHRRVHSSVARHDIAGVPKALMEHFSQRAQAIETDANRLVAAFAASHGRHPTPAEVLNLRQQATLQTRPDKQHHALRDLLVRWRQRASRYIPHDPAAWAAGLRDRSDLPALTQQTVDPAMLHDLAALALATVAMKRATFRHANLLAEVHRQLHGVRFATPADRLQVAATTTAIALGGAVHLNPSSAAVHRGTELYTTQAILDAESRLLDAGQEHTAPALHDHEIAPLVNDGSPALGVDQIAAVQSVATSGRVLDLLVGPAGTGKTTTLQALRTAWEVAFGAGSVVGLAPSAAAAQVLADSLAIPAENTSKWLHEHTQTPARQAHIDGLQRDLDRCRSTGSVRARRLANDIDTAQLERDQWVIRRGQLVIVDEASLADTATLDTLTTHIRMAGAKLLLVGDPHQLSPVDAGGALAMLAHDRSDLPELHQAHRFTSPWERDAAAVLRHGDPSAIDTYTAHGRVRPGERAAVLANVYGAWRRDTAAGLSSLMIAADRDTVAALNHQARTDRILTGPSTTTGVPIAHGVAGAGDRIITRRNDRTLRTRRGQGGWVKNGDAWTVTAIHKDGSLTVVGDREGDAVRLPGEYVRDHVDLGYAITAHTAQGRTVDTAHAVISPALTREALYVAATRGRMTNTLNVITDHDNDEQTRHDHMPSQDVDQVLRSVLDRTSADTSAHSVRARELQNTDRPAPVQPVSGATTRIPTPPADSRSAAPDRSIDVARMRL